MHDGHRRKQSRLSFALAVCVLALLGFSKGAGAQKPVSPEVKAQGRQLYDQGLTDYNLGHYTKALGAFENGYRIWHDPSFLFNIAQCERAMNQYEDAERTYRAYLRESNGLPEAQRDKIQRLIQEMERAMQQERAKQPPTGTQPPPSAQVVQQPAKSAPPAPLSPEQLRAARNKRIAGFSVGSFGIASLVLGAVFTGLAANENQHIVNGATWSVSTEDKRDLYQNLDIAFFVVGGVATATGLTLYLLGRHNEHGNRVQLTPMVGARSATATLSGSF
jgi:tetratricopeptide (TPR) repeat protein